MKGSKYEASRFREEAAQCRRLAEAMQSAVQRGHYLSWAEEYERMAAACERKGRAGTDAIEEEPARARAGLASWANPLRRHVD